MMVLVQVTGPRRQMGAGERSEGERMNVASERGDTVSGQVAIVTGGASGIGRSIAATLVAEGAKVGLVDVDLPAAETAARALGGRARAVRADVASLAEAQRMIQETGDAFGP